MRVYEASTLISAEFGGIRDLSRHLSLNFICESTPHAITWGLFLGARLRRDCAWGF